MHDWDTPLWKPFDHVLDDDRLGLVGKPGGDDKVLLGGRRVAGLEPESGADHENFEVTGRHGNRNIEIFGRP